MQKRLFILTVLGLALPFMASAYTYQTATASIRQSPDHGHLAWNGEIGEYLSVPSTGEYKITVTAAAMLMDGTGARMALRINKTSIEETMVNGTQYAAYTFLAQLPAGVHEIGVAFLNDGYNGVEDRNLLLSTVAVTPMVNGGEPSMSTESAWVASMGQREQDIVADTAEGIQTYRMGPAEVVVLDANGNPAPNAQVTVTQTTHDFLFGANLFGFDIFGSSQQNDAYKAKFSALFNFATLPFYWFAVEPTQGQPDYGLMDNMASWCQANSIQMKGHALLYAEPTLLPAWMNGTVTLSQQQAHLTEVMNRYKGAIKGWDLINEPYSVPGLDFDNAYAQARSLDPNASLIVNEYGQFYNGFDMFFANGYQELRAYLTQKNQQSVPFDVVGIQAHAPLDTAFPLETVLAHLDTYAALGKAIHITEFTPTSNGQPVLGSPWRGGVWDETTQADYAEDFYRTCFSHPAVEAISWWDICDTGAWLPNGGMLRDDLSPKPVYDRLVQLIHNEWRTQSQGATPASGSYAFRGFYGQYQVSVTLNGVTKTVPLHVVKGGDNRVTVSFPSTAPLTVIVNPVTTKAAAPVLSGTATGATQVLVSVNGSAAVNASVSGNTWSVAWNGYLADGTHNVQATAKNAAGNSVSDTTTNELVIDRTAPVVSLLGASSMSLTTGSTFSDPGATAADAREGNVTARIVKSGSVNTAAAGAYTLTYSATDSLGNASAVVTRTVTVTGGDTVKPVIALNGSATMTVKRFRSFSDPGATATDNVDGNITSRITKTGSVNTWRLGTYMITYNVKDNAGNAATPVTRAVIVVK